MKLYYSPGSCSLVIRILIHELNIDSEFVKVNLTTKKTEEGNDFLQISSKGYVPALEIDDGIIISENIAIQQYLTDIYDKKHTLLPGVSEINRFQVLELLVFISTEVHKGFSPLFNQHLSQELKDNIYKPVLFKKLDLMDEILADKIYLNGTKLALPDIYLFVVLTWLQTKFSGEIKKWNNLFRFYKQILKLESVKKSLHEENLNFLLIDDNVVEV